MDVEGTRQQLHKIEGRSCPLCRDVLGDDPTALVACAQCETRYHEGCFDELGGCAVLGCKHDTAIPLVSSVRPSSQTPEFEAAPPASRFGGLALALALAATLSLIATLLGLPHTDPPRSSEPATVDLTQPQPPLRDSRVRLTQVVELLGGPKPDDTTWTEWLAEHGWNPDGPWHYTHRPLAGGGPQLVDLAALGFDGSTRSATLRLDHALGERFAIYETWRLEVGLTLPNEAILELQIGNGSSEDRAAFRLGASVLELGTWHPQRGFEVATTFDEAPATIALDVDVGQAHLELRAADGTRLVPDSTFTVPILAAALRKGSWIQFRLSGMGAEDIVTLRDLRLLLP